MQPESLDFSTIFPIEITRKILAQLQYRDVFQAALTCQHWREILLDLGNNTNEVIHGNLIQWRAFIIKGIQGWYATAFSIAFSILMRNHKVGVELFRTGFHAGSITADVIEATMKSRVLTFQDLQRIYYLTARLPVVVTNLSTRLSSQYRN